MRGMRGKMSKAPQSSGADGEGHQKCEGGGGEMRKKGGKSGKLMRASDLLRGLLAYVLCVRSFRGLGAWGAILGIADMADTSWRERLRKASEWLAWIVSQQMQPEG